MTTFILAEDEAKAALAPYDAWLAERWPPSFVAELADREYARVADLLQAKVAMDSNPVPTTDRQIL